MLQLIRQQLAPKSIFWWGSTIVCFFLILYFSLLHPPNFNHSEHWFWGNLDKLGHALAYFALSLSLMFAQAKFNIALLFAIIAFSFLLELIQASLPLRHFDWADLCANGIGGLIAWLIASFLIQNQ